MSERERTYALGGEETSRRLELVDGAMWQVTTYTDGSDYGYQRYADLGTAEADALGVLRALGWTVETWTDPSQDTERTEVVSPWRQVDGPTMTKSEAFTELMLRAAESVSGISEEDCAAITREFLSAKYEVLAKALGGHYMPAHGGVSDLIVLPPQEVDR